VVVAALGALCRDHEVSRWRRADGAGPDEGGPRCKLTPGAAARARTGIQDDRDAVAQPAAGRSRLRSTESRDPGVRVSVLSVNTGGTHSRSIYPKLGAGDRSAAVQRARERQISIPVLKDGGQGRRGGPEPADSRLSVVNRFCGAPGRVNHQDPVTSPHLPGGKAGSGPPPGRKFSVD
jgi:hypothetical protein